MSEEQDLDIEFEEELSATHFVQTNGHYKKEKK